MCRAIERRLLPADRYSILTNWRELRRNEESTEQKGQGKKKEKFHPQSPFRLDIVIWVRPNLHKL